MKINTQTFLAVFAIQNKSIPFKHEKKISFVFSNGISDWKIVIDIKNAVKYIILFFLYVYVYMAS